MIYGVFFDNGMLKLDKNFTYSYDQNAIFGKGGLPDIPPYVGSKDFCQDKKFILIKQNPSHIKDDMYDSYEEILYKKGLGYTYFWIIEKESGTVKGPLLRNEFEEAVKDYGVSIKLANKFSREIKQ